jgi:DNA-binding NarL/FixJ family response regulator
MGSKLGSRTYGIATVKTSCIRIVIVEDEPELLQRFSAAIRSEAEFELLGAVASGAAAMTVLQQVVPDVVLVDLGLPDMSGIELIRDITTRFTNVDVLVVTMFGDDEHVLSSIEAGASGYLLKDLATRSIVDSIHAIRAGGSPISPTIARRILLRLRSAVPGAPPPASAPVPSPLSQRETDILKLVSKGLSFDEVGASLHISGHTVVAHIKKIYRKLAVHSRGEAVYEATQLGLL